MILQTFTFFTTLLAVVLARPMDAKQATTGVAFSFSGAGGRIGQHAALMSALLNGTFPGGKKIRPQFVAGASSGALSAVMMSAILETEDRNLGAQGITMDLYKQLLFNVDDSSIFENGPFAIAKIFTSNIRNGYILDNTPMENLIATWLGRMNYYKLGDLYLTTAISVVDQATGFEHRLWSDDPVHAQLNLLEVLLASTALPIAFKPRQITGLGNVNWIDGGTGVDTLPVVALLRRPQVKQLYVICYGSALSSGGANLPFPLSSIDILSNTLAVVADMRVDLFAAALNVVSAAKNVTSYLYLPKLPKAYSTLDFGDERTEFFQTLNYTMHYPPARIQWK